MDKKEKRQIIDHIKAKYPKSQYNYCQWIGGNCPSTFSYDCNVLEAGNQTEKAIGNIVPDQSNLNVRGIFERLINHKPTEEEKTSIQSAGQTLNILLNQPCRIMRELGIRGKLCDVHAEFERSTRH